MRPLSYSGVSELESYCRQVVRMLTHRDSIHRVECATDDAGTNRPHESLNADFLDRVTHRDLVYAIHLRSTAEWNVVYVGHTQATTSRQRIRNHLFKKHPKTGAQLSKVLDAVRHGSEIGMSFVAVDPPYIRCAVECRVIELLSGTLTWNVHGKH